MMLSSFDSWEGIRQFATPEEVALYNAAARTTAIAIDAYFNMESVYYPEGDDKTNEVTKPVILRLGRDIEATARALGGRTSRFVGPVEFGSETGLYGSQNPKLLIRRISDRKAR
jgi:hypothetical protein